jgi:HlyD family secretion protein
MKTARLIVFAVLLLAGGAAAWFFWPKSDDTIRFQGYVEGYLVFMAPEEGGRIEELTVDSGDRVAEGTMLFRLDASVQSAQRNEAAAKLQQTRAQLANLEAALRRPEEIAVLEAQEERAQAQLGLSQAELDRQRTLFERGIAAKAQYDQARTAFERDKAALAEVQRQIDAGQIAGRSGEIGAAEAAVQANEAALMQAETRLAKRQVKAPSDAQVQDVYFRAGETVNAGQPVLALLPPANRRIRFYVPEPLLATIALGQTVGLSCDSCKDGLQARISFISSEAEFTPPVIFSEPIGLPVTVTPAEPEPRS